MGIGLEQLDGSLGNLLLVCLCRHLGGSAACRFVARRSLHFFCFFLLSVFVAGSVKFCSLFLCCRCEPDGSSAPRSSPPPCAVHSLDGPFIAGISSLAASSLHQGFGSMKTWFGLLLLWAVNALLRMGSPLVHGVGTKISTTRHLSAFTFPVAQSENAIGELSCWMNIRYHFSFGCLQPL